MGGAPWSVFAVYLFIATMTFIVTLSITLPAVHLSLSRYLLHVIKPCAIVMALSLIAPVVMKLVTGTGMLFSLLTIIVTVTITGILCYTIGLDEGMRSLIKEKLLSKLSKK